MNNYGEKPKAGFVGFGEVNTPRDLIEKKCESAAQLLEEAGLELVKTSPVSDDQEGREAARAAAELARQDFDALIVCIAGWIPSWAVFSVIDRFKNKPMILLGLTGRQEDSRFITTADQAGTTALRKPMEDMGYRFKYVVCRFGAQLPVESITTYCRAATAAARLRNAKICMAGYRDMRLYGTLYDAVSLKKTIGPEVEHCDLLELKQLMDAAGEEEVDSQVKKVKQRWHFKKEPGKEALINSVKLCLAIKRKVMERKCEAFSYADVDGIKKLMGFAPAGAMTLLHDETEISTVPENDSLGAVTQLVVKFLTGQVAAYLEFYEFTDQGALMGVPDYVPSEIVDGQVEIMPTSFGDFGEGLLNVSRLKTGKATVCRLGQAGGKYTMHVMSGEAVTPPAWEEAGWAPPAPQLPGLEFLFDGDVEEFIQSVMSQHYIICYGDIRKELADLADMIGFKII